MVLGAETIGVVVVAFNSADVILDCVESLLQGPGPHPRIVVVDNASPDDTVETLRNWASGKVSFTAPQDIPFHMVPSPKPVALIEKRRGEVTELLQGSGVVLLHSGANRGFAGGVNAGLEYLAADPSIQHFWVLNPDAMSAPGTVDAILTAAAANPGYGLMGGRVCYAEPPHRVQIDGGTLNRRTGVTGNVNLGRPMAEVSAPKASELDFITGASMIASRVFYEHVGPMREDYFLYYEEVDWACRRGDLPMIVAGDVVVYHRAGTAIGSPTLERLASPFSIWFKHRGRMRFMRRFHKGALPTAWAYGMAKAAQMVMKRAWPQAWAILAATNGLPAPKSVRGRLAPEAAKIAFARPED